MQWTTQIQFSRQSLFAIPSLLSKCRIITLISHLDEAKKQPVVAYDRSPRHVIQVQLYKYLLLRL